MLGTRKSTLPPGADVLLGELEAGEGLAGAAGHDELAAVVLAEAGDDLVDRDPLVVARLLLVGEGEVLGRVEGERDQSIRECSRSDIPIRRTGTAWSLIASSALAFHLSVVETMIRSPNPALPEAARNESIIGLETVVVGREELALDRDVVAGVRVAGDQVDAGVVLARRARGTRSRARRR